MWEVNLSTFAAWVEHAVAPTGPGTYAISKGTADNLIYIGLTVQADGLRARLKQFHRSATTGQPGHAGGVTFNGKFGSDVADLLFAVHIPHAINPQANVMGAYTQYAERFLIWQHVARHGSLPACNTT